MTNTLRAVHEMVDVLKLDLWNEHHQITATDDFYAALRRNIVKGRYEGDEAALSSALVHTRLLLELYAPTLTRQHPQSIWSVTALEYAPTQPGLASSHRPRLGSARSLASADPHFPRAHQMGTPIAGIAEAPGCAGPAMALCRISLLGHSPCSTDTSTWSVHTALSRPATTVSADVLLTTSIRGYADPSCEDVCTRAIRWVRVVLGRLPAVELRPLSLENRVGLPVREHAP